MQNKDGIKKSTQVLTKALGVVAGLLLDKPRLVEQVGPGKQPKDIDPLRDKLQSFNSFLH